MGDPINTFNSRSTVSEIIPDTTVQELVTAHGTRAGLIIANDTNKTVYLRFDDEDATVSLYSFKLAAGAIYEMNTNAYQCRVSAIWADPATGSLFVTEVLHS
jgi:hypothetical protein